MLVSHRGSYNASSQSAVVGRRPALVGLASTVLALLSGCQRPPEEHPPRPADLVPYSGREARTTAASFPTFVTAEVRDGYQFALERPDVLTVLPCYCGCGLTSGHKSNLVSGAKRAPVG